MRSFAFVCILASAALSDGGGHAMKGPSIGTDPTITRDDARLDKMLEGSICRGC